MDAEVGFSIIAEKPGELLFAAYGNVNILVWSSSATLESVRLLDEMVPVRNAAFPEGVSAVHIVTETAGMPPAETRDAFAQQVDRWRDAIACVSVVVEKQGFFASALRSAVTGILLVSHGRFPTRVHGTIGEAAVWLASAHAKRTGVVLEPGNLRMVLEDVRSLRDPPRMDRAESLP